MRIIQSDNPRPLNLLAIGPNGLVAAACGMIDVRGDVEVWDALSGSRIAAWSDVRACGSVAFDPTGQHVVFSEEDNGITVASVKLGRSLVGLAVSQGVNEFALFPDGARLLVAAGDYSAGGVECWEFDSALKFTQLWRDWPGDYTFTAPIADPTGVRVAVAERYDGSDGRPRQEVSIREAASGKATARIATDPASPVQQLAFTADGSKVLVRTEGRTVQMFDAATGAPAGELVHPRRPYVTAIAVHPRGPVACARTDGTVTFWDAEKREQLKTLDWKAGKLVSVAFAPDGALAAAGTEDGKVIVWDVDV